MKKIILTILIIVSILIILFGIFASKIIKEQVRNEVMPTENIYIDDNDATDFIEFCVEIGSGLLGVVIIFYSVLAVACIWGIYGIIALIIIIVKKYKLKRNKTNK